MLRKYFALASLALTFTAGPAFALPDHHHPGTACKPNNGDLSKITYTDSQGAENNASSSATVYCSVDHFFSGNGAHRPASFEVRVIDRNGGAGVSCSLRGVDPDGARAVVYTASTSNSLNSATPQALTFTLPGVGSANYRNYFTLSCTLPASTGSGRSKVVAYKLVSAPL